MINGLDVVGRAFLCGVIPALATGIGGLIGLIGVKTGERWLDLGLGFSAGIMLYTSLLELLSDSLDRGGVLTSLGGFLLGVLLIAVIEKYTPHEHIVKGFEGISRYRHRLKTTSLILLAIIIHNIPEGMAVGAASYIDLETGLRMALSIGIQDIPEGYAVSFPLSAISGEKKKPLSISILSGLSETLMAILTAIIASLIEIETLLLSLAAGAMVYIISHEIIPETHKYGNESHATVGFITGFAAAMLITQIAM